MKNTCWMTVEGPCVFVAGTGKSLAPARARDGRYARQRRGRVGRRDDGGPGGEVARARRGHVLDAAAHAVVDVAVADGEVDGAWDPSRGPRISLTTSEPSLSTTTPDGHHPVGSIPAGVTAGGVCVVSTSYAATALRPLHVT